MKSVLEILKEIRPEFDFSASNDFMADGMLDSFDMVTAVVGADDDVEFSGGAAVSHGHSPRRSPSCRGLSGVSTFLRRPQPATLASAQR